MRSPSLDIDFWELESAEARHEAAPHSFHIPPRPTREGLRPGQHAKLLFMLEGYEDDGSVGVQVERMWVTVAEVFKDGTYIGILENQPASYEPGSDLYLVRGAEVPFRPEHVIQIKNGPAQFRKTLWLPKPVHRWPRE
jgi:hypothetical protein